MDPLLKPHLQLLRYSAVPILSNSFAKSLPTIFNNLYHVKPINIIRSLVIIVKTFEGKIERYIYTSYKASSKDSLLQSYNSATNVNTLSYYCGHDNF